MIAKHREISPDNSADEIQGPVLITPLHVQDRETSKVAGAPRAWRKLTQLQYAYKHERLGAIGSNDALRRLDAGEIFNHLWNCAQKAGRDSTAGFDAAGCMGSGTPVTEAQAGAMQRLVRIEMRLGENDRTIIRSVCALGYTPAEAMIRAKLRDDTRVTARLCEALDCLADACERTTKSKAR